MPTRIERPAITWVRVGLWWSRSRQLCHTQFMSDSLVELITSMKESLEREIRTGFERVNERFDRIEVRLDRQGGLIRSGQTNLVRLNDWSEKMDQLLAARDKRLDELEARLRKLESR